MTIQQVTCQQFIVLGKPDMVEDTATHQNIRNGINCVCKLAFLSILEKTDDLLRLNISHIVNRSSVSKNALLKKKLTDCWLIRSSW